MFRHPRELKPDAAASILSRCLEPLTVLIWGPLALAHLGVPIVVGVHMVVVRDEDYQVALQKLKDSGFILTTPNRIPPPEVMEDLPDPQAAMKEINDGYRRLDHSSTTFNYPNNNNSAEMEDQVFLIPNSFAHLPLSDITATSVATNQPRGTVSTKHYDVYGNLFYPHEQALIESLVKAAIDDNKNDDLSSWGELLRSWISMLVGYLDINHDILDSCPDEEAVDWYSTNFGKIREARCGPLDVRVTKRLGSGKEMPIDMRGHSIVD